MRLADFILANIEPILAEWEIFARNIGAGEHLTKLALRDNAEDILHATIQRIKAAPPSGRIPSRSLSTPIPDSEQDDLDEASDSHAVDRLGHGFNMLEVMSEYRALRASVLRLWHESAPAPDERDVVDLANFNESIDQSLSKAVTSYTRRVDQARDMFLAILSHDLRNPLNSIAMTAQVVPQVSNDPTVTLECSRLITRSVSVMERMIADLLDYTRTRLGAGMPVNPAPCDIEAIGRELYEEFQAAHPDREIRFQTAGNLQGEWDADRLRQAISNLLGNAIQHGSNKFSVDLNLRGDAAHVLIEVHNGGAPIPDGELPRIFDPLVRGSSAGEAKVNRPGSIGMGLYIAREVAKSHHGQIVVSSTWQHGTSFTIRLPRSMAKGETPPILDALHIESM